MNVLIREAHVVDPQNKIDSVMDILIQDGKVAQIDKKIEAKGVEVIDAKGLYVFPGLVDLHTHLREPGFENKETIQTGAQAARRGGYVACVTMPNTNPTTDNQSVIEEILRKGKEAGIAIFPCGAITKSREGKQISQMAELKSAGACAVSDDGCAVQDSLMTRRAMEYAATVDLLYIEHAEDEALAKDGLMHEGLVSSKLGVKGKPAASEDVITARDIELARLTGARLHMTHVSTGRSLELVRRAKAEGLPVTCDVTPHHIALIDEDVVDYDSNFKMNPPLRAREDREAILKALKDGTVDAIATDHAPHQELEKDVEFDRAPFGVIGLETALAVCLTELVHKKVLTLTQLVEKMSTRPAQLIDAKAFGAIRKGELANLIVVDIDRAWTVKKEEFLSKSKNSCFIGKTLKGKVLKTFCMGKLSSFGKVT